jgi:hypothetical protein
MEGGVISLPHFPQTLLSLHSKILSPLICYFGGVHQQSKQNGKGDLTFPVLKKNVPTLLYMTSFPARENCLRDLTFFRRNYQTVKYRTKRPGIYPEQRPPF